MSKHRAEIAEMHTYCRPHGSLAEDQFLARYVLSLPNAWRDEYGNVHVEILNTDGTHSRTMFSCHTDTVHRIGGRQGTRLDQSGILRLSKKSKKRSACLGADDTVGVFLMRNMIIAKRPGLYLFHYGEEAGCIGSQNLARLVPEMFQGKIDHAIAFDRKGFGDVITHQCGSRTCSDTFAIALAAQLNVAVKGLKYKPSSHGLFTDTDSYSEIIPECTNVSIGYASNHSATETVDTSHVLRLLLALLKLDASALPVDRDPTVPDPDDMGFGWKTWSYPQGAAIDARDYSISKDWTNARYTDLDCRLHPADYIDDTAYDTKQKDLDRLFTPRSHGFLADPLDDQYCEICGWKEDEHEWTQSADDTITARFDR